MKVMLTPPDLWGSTGYVSQADSGAPEATQTMYKVRHSSEDGHPQETDAENIILINRQRQLEEDLVRARVSRKWYLVVIVLLYIGLLASFSLNVTLLMRKPVLNQVTFPDTNYGYPPATTPTSDIRRTEKNTQLGFAYTTPCLVTVPCESGFMYDCNSGECQQCPHGSYQPQWGQTSCWPCPANTTTDGPGASSLDMCKSHACPFYAKEGVGIMESPNYPRLFPTGAECRWRVSPGHTRRVLLILPRLSLPPDCSASLTVSRSDKGQSSSVFSSCSSTQHPVILTGQSNNLWVEFKSGRSAVSQGFQLSVLSVQEELGYLVDAIINTGDITSFDSDKGSGNLSQEDKILLSRLLLLLNPSYQAQPLQHKDVIQSNIRHKKPVIEVLEDRSVDN